MPAHLTLALLSCASLEYRAPLGTGFSTAVGVPWHSVVNSQIRKLIASAECNNATINTPTPHIAAGCPNIAWRVTGDSYPGLMQRAAKLTPIEGKFGAR